MDFAFVTIGGGKVHQYLFNSIGRSEQMKPARFLSLVFLILIFAFSTLTYAGVPQMINYQGKLTTPEGALIDDTLSIVFTIYDAATDGGVFWTETQASVVVEKGIFSVLLGSVNPIPDTVFTGAVRYLGVKVEADPEMTPRKEIVSVGYAYKAEYADTAAYAHVAVSDGDWTFRITDTADTTLMTGGRWGIARSGNVLYGNKDRTHVNLGVACTTGWSGSNCEYNTVGGGHLNTASAYKWGTVGGGYGNRATMNATTVAGGYENSADGTGATVGGGDRNKAVGDMSTVGGGSFNTAGIDFFQGMNSTVGGGAVNTASMDYATVGGGYQNTASGFLSTVPGGYKNTAAGTYSFAAGYRAKANHRGTFVWADETEADFASTGDKQFLIRASGGVGIGTNSPIAGSKLHVQHNNLYAGYFTSNYSSSATEVIHSEFTGSGYYDAKAVYGRSAPADYWGIGGSFEGGFIGVHGEVNPTGSYDYVGVYGTVFGGSGTNYGLYGIANGSGTNIGVFGDAWGGTTNWAGYFYGNVNITGSISKGSGSFKIDHPLDPENKYLFHSFVESPDMKNVYDGVATLDASGQATVQLPAYFEALNRDFRYQLTAIGAPGPNLYIAAKIANNRFTIAGGEPGMEVSWQVTGIRHDKFAEANRIQVEVDKPDNERGKYLHPEAYKLGEEYDIHYEQRKQMKERLEKEKMD